MEISIEQPIKETGQEGGFKTFGYEGTFIVRISGDLNELKALYPMIESIKKKIREDNNGEDR